MQVLEPPSPPPVLDRDEREDLEQQIRHLQERLAFYEGFDALIQDNVTHARELFRLAALERESAAANAERARRESDDREATLRGELESIAGELTDLSRIVDGLAKRVNRALDAPLADGSRAHVAPAQQPVAVVVHGVASARAALSLQRYLGALPQVTHVAAREFVGGVLRLDATASDVLRAEQFAAWDGTRRLDVLTERPDVVEFALHETAGASAAPAVR